MSDLIARARAAIRALGEAIGPEPPSPQSPKSSKCGHVAETRHAQAHSPESPIISEISEMHGGVRPVAPAQPSSDVKSEISEIGPVQNSRHNAVADQGLTNFGDSEDFGDECQRQAQAWAQALLRLAAEVPPAPGLRPSEWLAIRATALASLREHGARAAKLGWTATELFGVHPTAGFNRVDCLGALVLGADARVTSVEQDAIRYANGLSYYRTLKSGPSVPIWTLS